MTIESARDYAIQFLSTAGLEDPKTDADTILGHFLSLKKHQLLLNGDTQISNRAWRKAKKALKERARFKPVAMLIGYRYFYRDRIPVRSGTLVPRPDTEHILYYLENLNRKFYNILEIGSGSACLTVGLARLFPSTPISGMDIRPGPARQACAELGLSHVEIIKQDFLRWQPEKEKQNLFDLIVSNPPYLSDEEMRRLPREVADWEPRRALYGGKDGLDFYRAIADKADQLLASDGMIVLETDRKWKKARDIFQEKGLTFVSMRRDYQDLARVIVLKKD